MVVSCCKICTVSPEVKPTHGPDGLHVNLAKHMSAVAFKLALSDEEKKVIIITMFRTDNVRLSSLLHALFRLRFIFSFLRPARARSVVVRIDPLRFLAGCRTKRLNQAQSVYHIDRLYISMLYYCIVVYQGPFLCIVSFHCYVCCLLVVLVKLSVLAK